MSEQPAHYNTNKLTGQERQNAIHSAKTQEVRIMTIFQLERRKMTPSQVHQIYRSWFCNAPVWSLRRAMTNLSNAGRLEKTDERVQSPYNSKEHKWQLPESKPTQTKINF